MVIGGALLLVAGFYEEFERKCSELIGRRHIHENVKKIRKILCGFGEMSESQETLNSFLANRGALPDITDNAVSICRQFVNGSDEEKDAVTVLALNSLIEVSKNETERRTLSDSAKRVIEHRYFSEGGNAGFLAKLTGVQKTQSGDSDIDRLLGKYSPSVNLILAANFSEQQKEESIRSLRVLIKDGKISYDSILSAYKTSVVASKKFSGGVDIFYLYVNLLHRGTNSFPFKKLCSQFEMFVGNSVMLGNSHYHLRILFLPAGLYSPSTFVEEVIEDQYSGVSPIGFIGVRKIGDSKFSMFPNAKVSSWSQKTADGWDLLANMAGSDVEGEIVLNELTVEGVLSILPINVFIPNEKQGVRDFIVSNYEIIKKDLKISKLSDWGFTNPEDLGKKLRKLDEVEKDKGIRTNCLKSASKWTTVATEIISEAKKYSDALNGQAN